jgi:hypothetical protein
MSRLLWAMVAAALAAGCGGEQKVKRAPPPLRPQPRDLHPGGSDSRTDCAPLTPSDGPAPLSYDERSIEEADNLAGQGSQMLTQAQRRPRPESERLIETAVHRLITALLADPYNVDATYTLAAAYARIGRTQCAINLLARLVPLRRLRSQAAEVDEKLDRLLGRKGYKGRLDPDFLPLRDDPRFREVVRNF